MSLAKQVNEHTSVDEVLRFIADSGGRVRAKINGDNGEFELYVRDMSLKGMWKEFWGTTEKDRLAGYAVAKDWIISKAQAEKADKSENFAVLKNILAAHKHDFVAGELPKALPKGNYESGAKETKPSPAIKEAVILGMKASLRQLPNLQNILDVNTNQVIGDICGRLRSASSQLVSEEERKTLTTGLDHLKILTQTLTFGEEISKHEFLNFQAIYKFLQALQILRRDASGWNQHLSHKKMMTIDVEIILSNIKHLCPPQNYRVNNIEAVIETIQKTKIVTPTNIAIGMINNSNFSSNRGPLLARYLAEKSVDEMNANSDTAFIFELPDWCSENDLQKAFEDIATERRARLDKVLNDSDQAQT